jgi:hypothetical protein
VPDTPPRVVAEVTGQSLALTLGFGLSIPVFFVTSYAWALWLLVPLVVRVVRRRARARAAARDREAEGEGDRHRHRHEET